MKKFGLSWLDNKREKYKGAPHMRLENEDATWKSRVIKTWQPGNEGKENARWLMAIESPHTYGSEDMGDTYVEEVLLGTGYLVEINGKPPTDEQIGEWLTFIFNMGMAAGERMRKEAEND